MESQKLEQLSFHRRDVKMNISTARNASDIAALRRPVLSLRGRGLSDSDLTMIGDLRELRYLDLTGCEAISDLGIGELTDLGRLEHLDLSLCSLISDISLVSVGRLLNLRFLSLNWCYNITDFGLESIRGSTSLEELSLLSCEKVTDLGVFYIASLPKLRRLYLPEFANITDRGLFAIADSATLLETLRLSNLSKVTDDAVQRLRRLPHLSNLSITGCLGVSTEWCKPL